MDPIRILKRAWHILWQYRALWIFGLILALTVGGTSGSGGGRASSNINRPESGQMNPAYNQTMPKSFAEAWSMAQKAITDGVNSVDWLKNNWTAILWVIAIFVLVMLLIGVIMTIARYVSETSVIRMVDEYEASGTKMSVRQGFKLGWNRTSWRLFLIDLLVSLPMLVLFAALCLPGYFMVKMIMAHQAPFAVTGFVGLIIAIVSIIFVMVVVGVLLDLLRTFFWRTCALENTGVMESIKRGFRLVGKNWKSVGLMWLIMLGVSIVWMIAIAITAILLIPVVIITAVIAALVSAVPGLLLVGIFSIFLSGPAPWIAAAVFILPLFITVATSPWTLVSGWKLLYDSIVWTLTYREIKTLPVLAAGAAPEVLEA